MNVKSEILRIFKFVGFHVFFFFSLFFFFFFCFSLCRNGCDLRNKKNYLREWQIGVFHSKRAQPWWLYNRSQILRISICPRVRFNKSNSGPVGFGAHQLGLMFVVGPTGKEYISREGRARVGSLVVNNLSILLVPENAFFFLIFFLFACIIIRKHIFFIF